MMRIWAPDAAVAGLLGLVARQAVGAAVALGHPLTPALVAALGVADAGQALCGLLLGERDGPDVLVGRHRDDLRGHRLADAPGAERAGRDVARPDPPLAVLGDEL